MLPALARAHLTGPHCTSQGTPDRPHCTSQAPILRLAQKYVKGDHVAPPILPDGVICVGLQPLDRPDSRLVGQDMLVVHPSPLQLSHD